MTTFISRKKNKGFDIFFRNLYSEVLFARMTKHRQNTYNVTLQSVWLTTIAMKTSNKCRNITSVCLYPALSSPH